MTARSALGSPGWGDFPFFLFFLFFFFFFFFLLFARAFTRGPWGWRRRVASGSRAADDEGYQDALYAFGTNASGALGWTYLRGNATNSVGRYGARKSMSADDYPSARAGACMGFIK